MQVELNLSETRLLNPASESDALIALIPKAGAATKPATATVVGQYFDQDVVGDLGNALNTFVESGQIWALLIGFILGYLLRGVTTYK
jgi:hypothetical protein